VPKFSEGRVSPVGKFDAFHRGVSNPRLLEITARMNDVELRFVTDIWPTQKF
jgi:hypothetical protein